MRLKRIFIIVALVLAVMLGGVIAVLGLANSRLFEHWLVDQANQRISGSIEVDGLDLSLLTGRAQVSALRIMDANDTVLATLGPSEVGISWWALLQARLVVTQFKINGFDLELIFDDQDQLTLVQAFAPRGGRYQGPSGSGQTRGLPVRLNDISLGNGRVHINRPTASLDARLGPIRVSGQIDAIQGVASLTMDIAELVLQWGELNHTVAPLALNMAYAGDDARPWRVSIQSSSSRVSVQGHVQLDGAVPIVDVRGQTDVDLGEVRPWLTTDVDFGGRLKTQVQLKGPLSDPWVALDLDLSQAMAGPVGVAEASARAVMDQRRVTIESLAAQGTWGRLAASGEVNLQPVFKSSLLDKSFDFKRLTHTIAVTLDGVQPWRIADWPVTWMGTWQGKAQTTGEGLPGTADYRARGHVDLAVSQIRLAPGGRPVNGTLTAAGSWDSSKADISQCRATIPDHVLEARGGIDWQQSLVDATGQLTSTHMTAFGRALGLELPQGRAIAKLTAKGPLTRPQATADVLAEGVEFKSFHLGRVLISAALDSQLNLAFPRLVLENQGSYLEGQGRLSLGQNDPAVELDLDLDPLEPADFMPFLPETVTRVSKALLSGGLRVSGSLSDPLGQLTLDPSPVRWDAFGATIQGAAAWQAGRLNLEGLELERDGSKVKILGGLDFKNTATGRWQSDPLIDLKASSDGVALEDFLPDFKGRLGFRVALHGLLSDPEGDFSLDGGQLELKGQPVHGVEIAGRIENRVARVDTLAIGIAVDQTIRGNGFFGWDQSFGVKLNGRDLSLAVIKVLQRVYPVDGLLDLDLDGSGSLSDPLITARIAVRQPRFNAQALDDFQVQAGLEGRRLKVDADINFHVGADLNLTSGDISLDVRFNQTDLAPWLSLTGVRGWQGNLSGSVNASGNWHAWQAMKVRIDVDQVSLGFNGKRLLSAPRLAFTLEQGAVTMPETRLAILSDGHLTLSASGEMARDLAVSARGSVPMEALAPFIQPDETFSGRILFQANVRGPWNKLQWSVDADLDQVAGWIPYFFETLSDVNGRLSLSSDRLTLSGLSGRIEDGRLAMGGQVRLKGLMPVDGRITLTMDRLPIQIPDTMDVVVNGDLVLSGAPDQARLEGGLILQEGLYYKNFQLDLWSLVSQPRRRQPLPGQPLETPPWMQNIALDVGLTHRNPFLVDNNIAYLEIVPDLKLTGTAARPVVTGRATVSDGQMRFRGKDFPVTRGVVDFVNPNKVEPILDIVSQTQIRQWLVTLSVSGTPSQLAVTLESNPPETENDILSLIIFGRTNAELTTGRGGGQATTRQMLAGLVASALGEDLKKSTGVDILELDTGAQSDEDSADRIQVTVGKKLTSRITVKYIMESNNGELIQRAVSEYRFLEHLLASGFQDSKGKYGGELLFRLEF